MTMSRRRSNPDDGLSESLEDRTDESTDIMLAWIKALPKVELHAHLTGSISRQCLHEIWLEKRRAGLASGLEDPLVAIPRGNGSINLATFFPIFDSYIYGLIDDEASLRKATAAVLSDFLNDGVVYLELRTTPRAIPAAGITKDSYVSIVLDSLNVFQERTACKMSVCLILSVDRRNTLTEALHTVDLAILHHTGGVVGVDLCGNPARVPINHLAPAFAKARRNGLAVTLHFAEIPAPQQRLPTSDNARTELQELLSWQPDRLGHVIHVSEDAVDEICKRKLGLELCLSCNIQAGMLKDASDDFGSHHLGFWMRRDCPIALSTDDVGIFESPLSQEYFLAAKHFGLSKAALFELAKSASSVIFGSEVEVIRLGKLFSTFAQQHGLRGE